MYNINVVILDSRLKRDNIGISVINQPDSVKYIVIYSHFLKDRFLYNIVEHRGKYIYEKYDFGDRFRELINEYEDKKLTTNMRVKIISKKIESANSGTRKIKIKKVSPKKSIKIKNK